MDLLLTGTKDVHEYDGADHRKVRQHRRDLRRERALIENDHVRRGYSAADIRSAPSAILRDIDRALGRPHDIERLEPWRRLWEVSLFSPQGTRRLAERWGLTGAASELEVSTFTPPPEDTDEDQFERIGPDPLAGASPKQ